MKVNGFTIIELLMVIAIMGILAAFILRSVNDARIEGIDAKVIAEMDSISKRAEIEQAQAGTYEIVCGSVVYTQSTTIADTIASINTLASTSVICNSGPAAYAVSVGLNDAHWCIDSGGVRKEIPNPLDNTAPVELSCP